MTAAAMKKMAFSSIVKEIGEIEALIINEASKGELKLITEKKISDAAKVYFTEQGFKFKLHLEPGKEIGASNKYTISWE